ncbi:hypothetical protein N9934_03280 [Desulfosarcina sp.]|nr:hypothetical protein [Desulfosarcina sp.]
MLKKRTKKYIAFFIVLAFIVLWSVLMFYIGPEELINEIGVRNGYILAFFMAVFGGVSALSSTSFYVVEVGLVLGGLNPYIVGVLGGIGLSVGDTLFFFLGNRAKRTVVNYRKKWMGHFSKWLNRRPKWIVPIIAFVYSGLTPLPNDVLMIAAAFSDIKYRRIIVPVLLGNIFLTTIIAIAALNGFNLI